MTEATVTVRFYAAARDAAGASLTTVPATEATTAAALIATLTARHGDRLGQVLAVASLVCAGDRVAGADPLPPGAAVDVLPPFAGG